MNTHEILTEAGFGQLKNYGEIAKWAASERWVSAGELLRVARDKYGHPKKKITLREKPIDYPVWGNVGTDIEYSTIEQMNTVMRLPMAVSGALMPDAHLGYAMPIGGVVVLDGAVSPSFVGYDIACRVSLSVLDITAEEFMAKREQIAKDMLAVCSFGKGAGFKGKERRDHEVMDDPLWLQFPHLKALHGLAWEQLGSSGGGNHFFDALIREAVGSQALPIALEKDFVSIMTHSGSRGVGHKMATYYCKLAKQETNAVAKGIPSGYEWLPIDSDAGKEYLAVMNLMGRYAKANHDIIHDEFSKRSGITLLGNLENHHNFAWVQPDNRHVIHRKGATPADKGMFGLIPGTSGTPSYIVEGLGNAASLWSSSHGAGRPFSRSEAKKRHDEEMYQMFTEYGDTLHYGVAHDETFMAYKDIDRVMQNQQDLVTPIAKMFPKIVIMGGKSDDGD